LENGRLFNEIRKKTSELEKANKIKDEFLGFVSHELKTPVNALFGYANMLQERMFGDINPQQEQMLRKMAHCSFELMEMIETLLEATRIEAGEIPVNRCEVKLSNFMEELRSNYSASLPNRLRLVWDSPTVLPMIRIDERKVKHIISNLINNAIKYTDAGEVRVSTRWMKASEGKDAETRRHGDAVNEKNDATTPHPGEPLERGFIVFEVKDTGIGIPVEELPFIFEMFRQVRRLESQGFGGVGLGLHIVKTFTHLLGGEIEVKSEVGKGSVFKVLIPAPQEKESADTTE